MSRQLGVISIALAAVVEVVTGLVVIFRLSLFARLLFGAELSAAGQALGRLAKFSLLALALACWPREGVASRSALRALLAFSVFSAVYLVYVGARAQLVGPLLWPAAALHAVLTIILARVWLND